MLRADFAWNVIFTAEMLLKLVALSPKSYFRDPWNCFDALLVAIGYTQVSAGL